MKINEATALNYTLSNKGRFESIKINETVINSKAAGFTLYDAAEKKEAVLYGNTEELSGGIRHTASAIDIDFSAEYTSIENGVQVSGTLVDKTGSDRLISLFFKIPLNDSFNTWWDDVGTKLAITEQKKYANSCPMSYSQIEQRTSLYPFCAASGENCCISLGIPMDPPTSFEFSVDNTKGEKELTLRLNFGLSPDVDKWKSCCEFSFVLYAPRRQDWGFRAAAESYYSLFPQYFVRRAKEGGNWLFQHNYGHLDNLEDFDVLYNETPDFAMDKEHGVKSFRYTAPGEVWIYWEERPKEPEPTYEEFVEHFEEQLVADESITDKDFDVPLRKFAKAILTSALLNKDQDYYTAGWHVYGPTVAFITNHNPDLPGYNLYNLQMESVKKAEKQAAAAGHELSGIYIDNMSWGYDGRYNYRREHFKYSSRPLAWDDDFNIVLPNMYSQYEYALRIKTDLLAEDKLLMANIVFPERGAVHYIHLVDLPGSEAGPRWGHDIFIQRLRRTLAYKKPWMLLMTGDHVTLPKKDIDLGDKELFLKDSLLYGIFANIWGYRPPIEEYEKCRPLFKKYTPSIHLADRLGWKPIPDAYCDDDRLLFERFGNDSEFLITAMNKQDEVICCELEIDTVIPYNELKVTETISNKAYDFYEKDGRITVKLELGKDEIISLLFENRSDN